MSVHKLHKQHTSVVMTVPKWVLRKLGVCAGEYVELDECSESPKYKMVCMTKLELRDDRDNQTSDRKDSGGGA